MDTELYLTFKIIFFILKCKKEEKWYNWKPGYTRIIPTLDPSATEVWPWAAALAHWAAVSSSVNGAHLTAPAYLHLCDSVFTVRYSSLSCWFTGTTRVETLPTWFPSTAPLPKRGSGTMWRLAVMNAYPLVIQGQASTVSLVLLQRTTFSPGIVFAVLVLLTLKAQPACFVWRAEFKRNFKWATNFYKSENWI